MWLVVLVGCCLSVINALNTPEPQYLKCPNHWVQHNNSCYKFVKSPQRNYHGAQRICKSFSIKAGASDLVSISSSEENRFLVHQLTEIDPLRRRWYIGAHQQKLDNWVNPDGTKFLISSVSDNEDKGNYLAFIFIKDDKLWGLQLVEGDEPFLFICEANIEVFHRLSSDDRDFTYGEDITDEKTITKGPFFTKHPKDVIFDVSAVTRYNAANLSCLTGGNPEPTYEWFKEYTDNGTLVARKIDPLKDVRYTISGGVLIIQNPQQKKDAATYHCKATNQFGTVISESAKLNFGFISEFVARRSPEYGELNFGKSIPCKTPARFPANVKYSWFRDNVPNLVEEDQRVFVSNDGTLYFSALKGSDEADYSCGVQSKVSDTGRMGPFFPLKVNSTVSPVEYQTLHFPSSPVLPKNIVAGREVRLECVAFGYPIPSYNWTRKDGPLPKNSYLTSFNRVLVIPDVGVEDQGEYTCRAFNVRSNITKTVLLDIQAEPNFTIPLENKHVDKGGDLVWTCEAFGIPNVNYTWWKNGKQLVLSDLSYEDRERINIQDNVLTISPVDENRDPGMYQCGATNILKTKYSSAQLRVLAFKPSFKKNPVEPETYAADNGKVTLKCNPEAAPQPKLVWMKDNVIVGFSGHKKMLMNGNLVIDPVSFSDEGIYTCVASNALGMDESKGRLVVLKPPQMVKDLEPRTVATFGTSLDLSCEAYIDNMLDVAYIWSHRRRRIGDIDLKNSGNRIYIDGGNLSVSNVTFSDAGEYECLIKSAIGQISSETFVVVEGPPGPPTEVQVISIQNQSVEIRWTDGDTHGSPITTYTISGRTNWNQDWVDISHEVRAESVRNQNGTKSAKTENVLTPWSEYEFRVAASNAFGMGIPSATSAKHSTPPDRPYTFPQNIAGGGGNIGDLTITWEPLRKDQQNGPGIHYNVFWKKMNESTDFQHLDLKEFGNTGSVVVTVVPNDYYTQFVVKVQAINDVGAGPISNEHVIFSAEDLPQAAPQSVIAEVINSTALNVTWLPISEDRKIVRGELIGYKIKYWRMGSKEAESSRFLTGKDKPWAVLDGLQPDTQYYLKVLAYNSGGEGPESERYIEKTYRKAPQYPPTSVHVSAINSSAITVMWRYVQRWPDEEEPIQGFKIRVWELDQPRSLVNETVVHVGEKLAANITRLSPRTSYELRIFAYSMGGDGRMNSPPLRFQMGDPEPPKIEESNNPVPVVAPIA